MKPKMEASKYQGTTFKKNDLALNAEPIFQSQVKRFQEAIQKVSIKEYTYTFCYYICMYVCVCCLDIHVYCNRHDPFSAVGTCIINWEYA